MAVQWHIMPHGCAWGCGLLGGCSCGSGISYEAPCLHSQPGRRPRFLPPGMLLSVPAYSHIAEILGCSDAFPFCPRLRHCWICLAKSLCLCLFDGFALWWIPFGCCLRIWLRLPASKSCLWWIPVPLFDLFWWFPFFRILFFQGCPHFYPFLGCVSCFPDSSFSGFSFMVLKFTLSEYLFLWLIDGGVVRIVVICCEQCFSCWKLCMA